MSFQYPLGLLGLIGVPILIIIYIIKSKFTEQTVSATYLWTLSEKFLKKKKKDNKLTGVISLILQILAVVIISFVIAHPVFTLPGFANEYCFVIDSSGSMNIVSSDNKTRFEIGKDEVREMIENSGNGSIYTIITVGNGTNVICEKESDKENALKLLDSLEAEYQAQNFGEALNKAQSYFDENAGVLTYLVTDKSYKNAENIEIINVSDSKDNYALSDISYEYSALGELTVKGSVISYENDAKIELQMLVNGNTIEDGAKSIDVKKAEPTEFSYTLYEENFETATLKILNSDALNLDNESVIINVKNENAYKTLLISATPFFLETVLEVVGNANVTVMSPSDYIKKEEIQDRSISGYGLYVFHSCNPKSVPKDGSVWLINSTASIENSGFNYQGEIKLDRAETLDKTSASSSLVKKLLENVSGDEIYVSKYSKYDTYRSFNTLFSHNGNPAIFTGVNTYGNREVVFAFDIHNSDMPLLADYVTLVKNLLDYSFPMVVEETYYSCGDTASVNIVSNCNSIHVESPSGKIKNLSMSSATCEFELDEVGTYKIKATIGDEQREYRIYSEFPDSEKDPVAETENKISLSGKASGEGLDGIYDKLIIFFICLAVVIAADWVVYCYEKYQLR